MAPRGVQLLDVFCKQVLTKRLAPHDAIFRFVSSSVKNCLLLKQNTSNNCTSIISRNPFLQKVLLTDIIIDMKKSKPGDMVTVNRKAHYDYTLGDELTVGMSLSGPEVRSIRDHHVQLKGSFVTIRNSELWLNNLTLGAETARNIKLLATKKQIANLER